MTGDRAPPWGRRPVFVLTPTDGSRPSGANRAGRVPPVSVAGHFVRSVGARRASAGIEEAGLQNAVARLDAGRAIAGLVVATRGERRHRPFSLLLRSHGEALHFQPFQAQAQLLAHGVSP